jgi:hypothetical protein
MGDSAWISLYRTVKTVPEQLSDKWKKPFALLYHHLGGANRLP